MAWNPSFSFKLRDDEITFGTLIFDKNCADMLCQELLRIKQGGQVSIDVIREILDKGCFTDTELDNARAELEDIKQDIFEFKQMLTSRQRFEAWYDTTASAGAYIIGSQSWYQHYMSLKMTAADMYFKLVSSGEQFNQQAKDAYEKRYGEVLRESSAKERTELALRRQFDKNVANGVSNAREIYCEAMMVAGLMSEQQVEAQNKLFKAAGSSEVESTIKESTKELPVSKLIEQLWLEVEAHSDMMHKALAIERFVGHLDKIFYNTGLSLNTRLIEEAINNFFATKTIDAGELYTKALAFKRYLDNGRVSESIKNTYIKIEQDNIDKMLQSLQNIKSMGTSVDLEEEIEPRTAESLIDLFKKTEDISDVMKRALIIADIAKIALHTFRYAEISCAGFWEESIEEFLKGTGSAGTMIELAEVFTVVLSFKSNINIINSCALEYKDGEYTALLRKINEAQFN